MTQFAFDNFDSDTAGSIAPGWTAVTGTWQVGTTNPVSGTQSFSCTTHVNAQKAVYTGGTPTTDQETTFFVIWAATAPISPMARMDATAQNGYVALPSGTTLSLFRFVGGAATSIKTGTYTAPSNGDTVGISIRCSGTTIEGRIWNVTLGQTRPSTPTCTVVDTNTASGVAGAYNQSTTQLSFDNFTWTDGSTSAANVTMTGPTTGVTGASSDAFIIGGDGAITSNVPVTLSDGGAGGSFYPSATVTLTSAAPVANVTYLRPTSGASTISATNTASLGNPTNITYTASATKVLIPVDNASITWSPFNWDTLAVNDFGVPVKSKQTSACGAYAKFKITGTTSIALAIDASQYLAPFTSSLTPRLEYRVWAPASGGNGTLQRAQLSIGSSTFVLASGLTTGTVYEVEVYILGMTQSTIGIDRWGTSGNAPSNSPINILRTQGFIADSGATASAHSTVRPKLAVFYGDSIPEGVRAAGSITDVLDHAHSAPWFVGPGMNAEIGILGYGGTSFGVPGSDSMPALTTTYNLHSAGRSRSITAADYVFIWHGANGTSSATVQTALTSIRAAAPSAWIFMLQNIGGINNATNLAGYNAYIAANPGDVKTVLLDPSARMEVAYYNNTNSGQPTPGAVDGLHPLELEHSKASAAIVALAQAAVDGSPPATSARTVTLTLVDSSGVARANLSGLKWALFDRVTPDILTAPASTGTGATTNGSGVLTLSVQSSLAAAATAWLVISDSDGTVGQSPAAKAFAGPVTLS